MLFFFCFFTFFRYICWSHPNIYYRTLKNQYDFPGRFGDPVFYICTDTNIKNGGLGAIYTEYRYADSDSENAIGDEGNNKTEETDARGNKTLYEYDPVTSKPTAVIDRCGNRTEYGYDASGRTRTVNAPNGGSVLYDYNAMDDLTGITRGDGQQYGMSYDAYRNLTKVSVDGQTLVDYTYKPATGRLKTMTYANGAAQKLNYDAKGNLVSETWTNGSTTEAKYRYFYDSDQNLVKTLDILGGKQYNINRQGDNITSIEEYNVTVSDDLTVSNMELVGTMQYSFDSDGKQFRKKYVDADGNEQKYLFEYRDEQNVAVQLPTGAVSHAKTDHLGRKVFDEIQLGNGFLNRRFTYYDGVLTDTHAENNKRVSNPETTLVKTIDFADGRKISYEYDREERITKVIDTVNGNATVTEYTYDEMGQLLTETVNGTLVNSMTYDQYGNILTKNGVQYGYANNNGGCCGWKDRLTSYGSDSITYDANGNPLTYKGNALEWTKGRQLKQYGNSSFIYNNEGIRTSKTVNGVTHTYTLDGTNIVKETWNDNTLIPLYDLDGTVCGIKYNNIVYYFYKNLQGDVIAITDVSGEVVATYSYDAWGVPTITQNFTCENIAAINPFRYRGYYYDTDIGLYYLQSRYYDPEIGRFVNADIPEFAAVSYDVLSHSIFVYCQNDPVCFRDEKGYFTSIFAIGFVGIMLMILLWLISFPNNQNFWELLWQGLIERTSSVLAGLDAYLAFVQADKRIKEKLKPNSNTRYWSAKMHQDAHTNNPTKPYKYVTVHSPLTYGEAQTYVASGQSVFCVSKTDARRLICRFSGITGPEKGKTNECSSQYWHYHVMNRMYKDQHVFYLFDL